MIGNSALDATAFLYVLKICGVAITVFDRPLRAALHHLIELRRGQLDFSLFPDACRYRMK